MGTGVTKDYKLAFDLFSKAAEQNYADAIAFLGNKLYAKSGGKLFVRTFAHTGWNCWEKPIDVKSQGQG